jgi:hypothetical protein
MSYKNYKYNMQVKKKYGTIDEAWLECQAILEDFIHNRDLSEPGQHPTLPLAKDLHVHEYMHYL